MTNNHPILKIDDIALLKEDKSRNKWWKGKIIKSLCGKDNLVRVAELLTTQTLKGMTKKLEDHFKWLYHWT